MYLSSLYEGEKKYLQSIFLFQWVVVAKCWGFFVYLYIHILDYSISTATFSLFLVKGLNICTPYFFTELKNWQISARTVQIKNLFFNSFLRYWVKAPHHSPFLKNTSKIMSNASKNPRRKAVLKSLTRPKGKRQRVTMTSLQRICSPLRPTGIMLEKKNIPYLGTL